MIFHSYVNLPLGIVSTISNQVPECPYSNRSKTFNRTLEIQMAKGAYPISGPTWTTSNIIVVVIYHIYIYIHLCIPRLVVNPSGNLPLVWLKSPCCWALKQTPKMLAFVKISPWFTWYIRYIPNLCHLTKLYLPCFHFFSRYIPYFFSFKRP